MEEHLFALQFRLTVSGAEQNQQDRYKYLKYHRIAFIGVFILKKK